MRDAVIVSASRTPIGKFKGDLAGFTFPELAALVLRDVIGQVGLEADTVDEVILGNLFAGDWGNVARASLLEAGFPLQVAGLTVDRQCSSGVNAVGLAASMIQTNMADVIIAGGVESYSRQPYYVERPRAAFPAGIKELKYKVAPARYVGGCLSSDMINTAENLARQYQITREECDCFAMDSHLKAAKAWESGCFDEQVVEVRVPQRKGEDKLIRMDACIRPETSMESLAKLRPIMEGGVVTAGNASPMNDGAAVVLVMSADKARELGLKPLAVVREYAACGVEPTTMGIGPVFATRKLMQRHGYTLEDFDLIELNEAFAAQSLACIRELGVDPKKVNVEGGAIAIGHPNGASGGMLTARLVYALRRRNLKRGLVSFCIGGGQGFSLVLENPDV